MEAGMRFVRWVVALTLVFAGQWAQAQADKGTQAPRGAPGAKGGTTEVLWLGQSAIKLTTPGGKVIVIDPYLKNPKTPEQYKNLDALGKVDLLLVTHAHADHLGDAPDLAKKHDVPLWAPSGLAASLSSLGVLPANLVNRMSQGGSIRPFGPFLTGTPDEYIKALGKTSTKVFAIDPGDKLEF
jgi:L-ascorbate metabolism protein UlaG (beta-lactamase superfamily)